jgi:hypothetical protein
MRPGRILANGRTGRGGSAGGLRARGWTALRPGGLTACMVPGSGREGIHGGRATGLRSPGWLRQTRPACGWCVFTTAAALPQTGREKGAN